VLPDGKLAWLRPTSTKAFNDFQVLSRALAPECQGRPIRYESDSSVAVRLLSRLCHRRIGAASARNFDRKTERAAVEKFYAAREFAPLWTQGGLLTESGKGVIARLKDAAFY